jgi:hypothetical protein
MNARFRRLAIAIAVPLALLAPMSASAHCDGVDGPVAGAARQALEDRNINRALIWVQPGQDAEVRHAFDKALAVRGLGGDAKELADRHFLETLVRVHRAGEGAPYDGLKPAGRDLGPAIPAADAALKSGSADAVARLITHAVDDGVREQFQAARAHRAFAPDDVAAGREYVAAYVRYVHYVEGLYDAARKASSTHEEGTGARHAH